ncbi:MAG: LysR substrate-binding domain-containing protein [Archangium sp.]
MNQLLAMKVFVRIVDSGSFARAAVSLKLPRTAVTRLVQSLEKHLGVQLLARTTRRVAPTPEGVAYAERARALLAQLEAIDSEIGGSRSRPRGRLRVDIGSALANLVVIPALPAFTAKFPEIQLELGVSDRNVDLVSEGVDCVLRGGVLPDTSHRARKLAELPFVTCASPAWVKKYGMPSHPSALRGKRVLAYGSSNNGRAVPLTFWRGEERVDVDGPMALVINDGTACVSAMRAGLGVAQTLRFMVREELEDGSLVELLPEWSNPPVPLHLVMPANTFVSPRVRVFSDWVATLFS